MRSKGPVRYVVSIIGYKEAPEVIIGRMLI